MSGPQGVSGLWSYVSIFIHNSSQDTELISIAAKCGGISGHRRKGIEESFFGSAATASENYDVKSMGYLVRLVYRDWTKNRVKTLN